MKAKFLEAAEQDLAEAAAFYNAAQPGLGREFTREVKQAVLRISRHPLAWPRASEQCRKCITHRFPYTIVYRVLSNEVQIVAVAHHSREPTFWEERLNQ